MTSNGHEVINERVQVETLERQEPKEVGDSNCINSWLLCSWYYRVNDLLREAQEELEEQKGIDKYETESCYACAHDTILKIFCVIQKRKCL